MFNSRSLLHAALPCILISPWLDAAAAAQPPQVVYLWPDGAPGATGDDEADRPAITVYLPPPAKASTAGVVICPGGGYGNLATDHEGRQVAQWLNENGVAAFVLRYRHAPKYRHPHPLQDAQRAVRVVRTRAAEWRAAPDRIGIMGFSAGGHLASTVGTHYDAGNRDAADVVERASCRPDFLILCYPVITFTEPCRHLGSIRNLLGQNPDPKLLVELSNEKHVTPQTPPTFLFHTDADTGVPPENSILFYTALRRARVPAEMHIYEQGPHGVGLAPKDPVLSTWPARCVDWLRVRGLLTAN